MAKLGHEFSDPTLMTLALTHRSMGGNNNERLEFLGDSILNFLIGEALFEKFSGVQEGQLSQMRAQLVKGKTLAEVAREFELGDYLLLGQGELKSGGFRRASILADAVEALIGAIYIDAGMERCRELVRTWYHSRLQAIMPKDSIKDAKSRLQELLQAQKKPLPKYHLAATSGDDHARVYRVECEVEGLAQRMPGEGSSRRHAEQAAAQAALIKLQPVSKG